MVTATSRYSLGAGWTLRTHDLGDKLLPGVAGVTVLLMLWELVVRFGVLDEQSIPRMTSTVAEFYALLVTSEFWTDVGLTLAGWAMGLGIALVLAVPVGLVLGSSSTAYHACRFLVEFLRPIPAVALVPVAMLLFSIGMESKVFLAAFGAFWPILIHVLYGMRDVDPTLMDTARSYNLSRLQRLTKVTLPSTMPYLITGVRISSTVALMLAVTAELLIGSPGLGNAITRAQSGGAMAQMYALIITAGLLGLAVNYAGTALESRALHWHPSQRSPEV